MKQLAQKSVKKKHGKLIFQKTDTIFAIVFAK